MPVPTSTTVPDNQSNSQSQETFNNNTNSSTTSTTESTQTTNDQPSSTENLPDATLDFAAKMFDLARQGDPTLLSYLSAGLPSDLTNSRGDTLLMLASYHGHSEMVSSMLNPSTLPQIPIPSNPNSSSTSQNPNPRQIKPSNPNSLNARGQSPVAGAVFKGHDEVVKVLIQGGADPLAGQPSAEDTAKMFKRWQDSENSNGNGEIKKGFKELFENAIGRGKGANPAPPAVPDREQGPTRTVSTVDPSST